MYAKSGAWTETINSAQKHNQIEYIVELLKQRAELILRLISEWDMNLKIQVDRLFVLRDLKVKLLEDWTEGKGDADLGQSETMSEASTMSNMSRLSTASSASSRKRKNVSILIFNI